MTTSRTRYLLRRGVGGRGRSSSFHPTSGRARCAPVRAWAVNPDHRHDICCDSAHGSHRLPTVIVPVFPPRRHPSLSPSPTTAPKDTQCTSIRPRSSQHCGQGGSSPGPTGSTGNYPAWSTRTRTARCSGCSTSTPPSRHPTLSCRGDAEPPRSYRAGRAGTTAPTHVRPRAASAGCSAPSPATSSRLRCTS